MMKTKEKIRLNLFEGIVPPKKVNVLLWNDDTTLFDFVLLVLVRIFRLSTNEAIELSKTAQSAGKAVVGQYPRDIAQMKVNSAVSVARRNGFYDFKMTVEEE